MMDGGCIGHNYKPLFLCNNLVPTKLLRPRKATYVYVVMDYISVNHPYYIFETYDLVVKTHLFAIKNSATFNAKVAELRCVNDRLMI